MRRPTRLRERLDKGTELLERAGSLDQQAQSHFGLQQGPISWLVTVMLGLASTTALWLVAAVTPWLEVVGPFGWFIVALTGALGLARASVPASAWLGQARSNWRNPRHGEPGSPTSPQSPDGSRAPAKSPPVTPRPAGFTPASEPAAAKTEAANPAAEEQGPGKRQLVEFIVEAVLPASNQLRALQQQIFGVIVSNGTVRSYLNQGVRYDPGSVEYFEAIDALGKAARENHIHSLPRSVLIRYTTIFLNKYHFVANIANDFMRSATPDEIAHPALQNSLAQWKQRHDALSEQYEVFRKDTKFDDLYRPAENVLAKPIPLEEFVSHKVAE